LKILALSNNKYLRSIEEERRDYKEGRAKYLEEISDVWRVMHSKDKGKE